MEEVGDNGQRVQSSCKSNKFGDGLYGMVITATSKNTVSYTSMLPRGDLSVLTTEKKG